MPNPKAVGETTEAVILAHMIQRGDGVLLPFGNNQRYDMVIDRGGRFIRAQCKTGRLRNGVVLFSVTSCNGLTGEHRGYHGQADVFLVWCPDINAVYEVPVEACGKATVSLRIEQTRNGQKAFVRSASEYLVPLVGFEPTASIL